MRRVIIDICFVAASLLFVLVCASNAQFNSFPPGTFNNRAALYPGAGGGGFSGPGDVVSGSTAWFSTARAYNASFAAGAGAIADLVDTATGLATCTMNIGTNGFANLSALSCAGGTLSVVTFCTVTHPAGCSITKVYDQTGNGKHVLNVTLSQMPNLTFNAINSLPGMTLINANADNLIASGFSISAAYSMSTVYKRTATSSGAILDGNSTGIGICGGAANQVRLGGGFIAATASDSAYHAVQGVVNGASSVLTVEGSDTTGTASGNYSAESLRVGRGSNSCTGTLDGTIMEAGYWPSGFSGPNRTAMNTNQHSATVGYNF
jgi:hypothetical protein